MPKRTGKSELEPAAKPTPVYTIEEVAQLLKIHPESTRRAVRDGRIPATKFGSRWRINELTVSKLIASGIPSEAR